MVNLSENQYREIASRLSVLFQKIFKAMKEQRETNWIRAIEGIIAILEDIRLGEEKDFRKSLVEVKSTFYNMSRPGHGSFEEFFIWHEDFNERKRLNKEFLSIKEEIWKLLEFVPNISSL